MSDIVLFDISNYQIRELNPAKEKKPLDIGGDGLTASLNSVGRFISVSTFHAKYGYCGLSNVPPFPDTDRYDASKVRAYRKSFAHHAGFGVSLNAPVVEMAAYLIEDYLPFLRFVLDNGCRVECLSLVANGAVRQRWKFSQPTDFNLSGSFWLMRAAYTQITEGGMVEMPSPVTRIQSSANNRLQVINPALSTVATLTGLQTAAEHPNGSISLAQNLAGITEFEFSIHIGQQPAVDSAVDLENALQQARAGNRSHRSLVLQRAYRYADICLLKTDESSAAILTDHMILPLSWNRDAYYVAQMYDRIPEAHLNWCFFAAWRGTFCRSLNKALAAPWGRSYMANGKQKDSSALQLDQQIFPLMEFFDLYNQSPSQEALKAKYKAEIIRVLDVIRACETGIGLYVTDETPADDDLHLAFHFSTHILLWHTLRNLALIFPELETQAWADRIHAAIYHYFPCDHEGRKIFAYATDGAGHHYLYHDANDIPLVMMPLWEFCDKDDVLWQQTIAFAFSPANPAFFNGVLGSVHSPSSWTLGDAQELILCKITGDKARYQLVWERVENAAQWDGALPEAYDGQSFAVVTRQWFAWPNAMVAIADKIPWM
ncbi:MAG: glycoside hydrolase family 125 protein [Anaerolineae bacterium]